MIHKSKKKKKQKDRCVVARVVIGFRAGYHHIEDKCGIKQKLTLNNKYI